MNMVRSLGRDYFNNFFAGALFLKDDKVLRVEHADSRVVACLNITDASSEQVPAEFFTGFKTFNYPVLGYRRLKPHVHAFLTKKQSVHRGLRSNTMNVDFSGATHLLNDLGIVRATASESERALAAFSHQFDNMSDLPKLLSGEVSGLVLSPHILIEPSVEAEDGWYSIFYKRALIGKMNSRGGITWTSPNHSDILRGL